MKTGAPVTTAPPTGRASSVLPVEPDVAVVVRRFAVLDTVIAISVDEVGLAAAIDHLLGDFVASSEPAAVRYSLSTVGDQILAERLGGPARRTTPDRAVAWLLADLNRVVLDRHDGFAVHSGAVASAQRVVCFPAPSGAGKSTLVAACVGAGFDYVSDEALCFDRAGDAVVPYPRPLALSARSLSLVLPVHTGATSGVEQHLTPAQLGGRAVTGRPTLAHVVHLERIEGAPRLEPLERFESVPALLSLSFNLYKDPDAYLELAARAARRSRAWRLSYDDPRAAATLLAERLA